MLVAVAVELEVPDVTSSPGSVTVTPEKVLVVVDIDVVVDVAEGVEEGPIDIYNSGYWKGPRAWGEYSRSGA